jgi:hypothetical protein
MELRNPDKPSIDPSLGSRAVKEALADVLAAFHIPKPIRYATWPWRSVNFIRSYLRTARR